MKICKLEIYGFRGIKSATIHFQPHTVLLGPNAVGKSAIVDALGLVFGRERLVRQIGDHDFYGSSPSPESRIKIIATITGFPKDDIELNQLWFNTKDGAVAFWWDPDVCDIKYEEDLEGCKLCCKIAFVARFDEETLEYETIRYFYDGDTDPFEDPNLRRLKGRHLKELGFFLLPSNRTWDRVLSFASDLFKKVLKFQEAMPGKAISELKEWLKKPGKRIEEDSHLKSIIDRVNSELSGFIGKEEAVLQFLPTTGDVDGVLQALFPYLKGKADVNLPLGRHGSGVISLQTLLLLFEFGRARSKRGENFILVTEEPELHLHPGHHRRLVSRIRGVSNQSITTTHSPEVVAYYKPEEIFILKNEDGDLSSVPLLRPSESIPDQNALLRLFTIYRAEICNALMNRIVLIPEGITEFMWFNSLLRSCVTAEGWKESDDKKTPQTIAIMPTQNSHVVTTYDYFQTYVEHLAPIVDGDDAGNEYVKSLKKASKTPKIIFQLPDDWSVENLIAWIVSPSKSEEWSRFQDLLDFTDDDLDVLANQLKDGRFKTRWDIHEEIIAFVAVNTDAANRARKFFKGLSELTDGASSNSDTWNLDVNKSNDNCAVWRFAL